jgi:hypothetical protein
VLAGEGSLEFVFKLEGRVDDLEVFDLIRTFESMKVSLQEANRTVNPHAPDIRVAVRPIKAGSYEIHYALSYLPENLQGPVYRLTWRLAPPLGPRPGPLPRMSPLETGLTQSEPLPL